MPWRLGSAALFEGSGNGRDAAGGESSDACSFGVQRGFSMSEVLDEPPQQKLALNQVLFREVNEKIRSLSSRFGDEASMELICECSQESCMTQLTVSPAAYEEVRQFPARFFVAPGHEIPAIERVVAATDVYNVVEKFGEAGPVAARTNPRGQGKH